MEITDLIQRDVVTVYIDDSILTVLDVLRENQVGSAVVIDAHEEPVGIVTDRDLVVYGREFIEDVEGVSVNRIMSSIVFTAPSDTGLLALTEQMRSHSIRRVPIVDDGKLVGIISLDDLIVSLAERLDNSALSNLAAVIAAESPNIDEQRD